MRKHLVCLAACWLALFHSLPAAAKTPAAKTPLDACALLTGAEIAAIQGETPDSSKSSLATNAGLKTVQCYFALHTLSHSISLDVIERDGVSTSDPRAHWKSLFEHAGSAREKDRDKASEPEDEERREQLANTVKVAGIGDQAYWSGSSIGGSLYVLKRHRYLRISVGGAGTQAEKISKSKALARIVLKRI